MARHDGCLPRYSHGHVVLSIPCAALGSLGHLLKEGSEENPNVMGDGAGLFLLEMLLIRMEKEVGELLAAQNLCWCSGKAVPAPGSHQPWPHAPWVKPTLTIGHADRAVDDFTGIVVDGDGDLVGGHQFPVEGSFDLHSSWEPQKDGGSQTVPASPTEDPQQTSPDQPTAAPLAVLALLPLSKG